MLVIELKAPYISLSLDVYNQVVRYANTIKKSQDLLHQIVIGNLSPYAEL